MKRLSEEKELEKELEEVISRARRKADGSLVRGWFNFEKTMFWLVPCSVTTVDAASKFIPPILEKYPYLGRFIDVTPAVGLMECYSKEHPLSRSEDRENKRKLLTGQSRSCGQGSTQKILEDTGLPRTRSVSSAPIG